MGKTWFSLDPYNFGFVQEKMDIVGPVSMQAALNDLVDAVEKDAEQVARDLLHAYLLDGGDPEVLLEDLRKFQGSEKDDQ